MKSKCNWDQLRSISMAVLVALVINCAHKTVPGLTRVQRVPLPIGLPVEI